MLNNGKSCLLQIKTLQMFLTMYMHRPIHTYINIYITTPASLLSSIVKLSDYYICVCVITLSVLDLGAVQIDHSAWQHPITLQPCVAHCSCSLSTLRCDVEKSLRTGTTNETVFSADIILLVGIVCQNALYSAYDATDAETVAVRRLNAYTCCI